MEAPPNDPLPSGNFEFTALQSADNYRRALVRAFSVHLRGHVIEVGCGVGQLTEHLRQLRGITRLLCLEPDPGFCRQFRSTFPSQPLIQGTIESIVEEAPCHAILSVNVLEHILEDALELAQYGRFLRAARGRLCLFVPARPEIYAPIDGQFGHHRRYTKADLRRKLLRAGFDILRLDYFNSAGYFAWWLLFRVLGKRKFNVAAVRFFDRAIFPWVHGFESRILAPPFGQSLIAVAQAG
jgi:SAM-dependent methyltransferase